MTMTTRTLGGGGWDDDLALSSGNTIDIMTVQEKQEWRQHRANKNLKAIKKKMKHPKVKLAKKSNSISGPDACEEEINRLTARPTSLQQAAIKLSFPAKYFEKSHTDQQESSVTSSSSEERHCNPTS
jgi:hypothetical protein